MPDPAPAARLEAVRLGEAESLRRAGQQLLPRLLTALPRLRRGAAPRGLQPHASSASWRRRRDHGAATDTRREAVIATPVAPRGRDRHKPKPRTSTGLHGAAHAVDGDDGARRLGRGALRLFGVGDGLLAAAGNRIGIDRLTEKPFEWFAPQQRGGLLYPLARTRRASKSTPNSSSSARCASRPTASRTAARSTRALLAVVLPQEGWQFWMKHLERWGSPSSWATPRATPRRWRRRSRRWCRTRLGRGGHGRQGRGSCSGQGTAHFEEFERAVCARVQKVILGQTLTTDAGGSTGRAGSYALGKMHNEVREDRRNADLRLITRSIQHQVNALWTLNASRACRPPSSSRTTPGCSWSARARCAASRDGQGRLHRGVFPAHLRLRAGRDHRSAGRHRQRRQRRARGSCRGNASQACEGRQGCARRRSASRASSRPSRISSPRPRSSCSQPSIRRPSRTRSAPRAIPTT
jgi:hypothetical protein